MSGLLPVPPPPHLPLCRRRHMSQCRQCRPAVALGATAPYREASSGWGVWGGGAGEGMLCTRGARGRGPKGEGETTRCLAPLGHPLTSRVSSSKRVEQARHTVRGGGRGWCVVPKAQTPDIGGGGGVAKAALLVSWSPTGGQPTACNTALWWLKFGPTGGGGMGGREKGRR